MRCTFRIEKLLKDGLVELRCIRTEKNVGLPKASTASNASTASTASNAPTASIVKKYTDTNPEKYFMQLWKARWSRVLKTYTLIDPFENTKQGRIPLKTSREIPKLVEEHEVYFEDYED